MGCGCKKDGGSDIGINQVPDETQVEISKLSIIRRYTFRVITFLFALVLLPLLLPVIIWMLFKTIILTEQINMLPLLLHVGKKLKKMGEGKEVDEDDDDDNLEEINPDDYELVGVNHTTKR